jgi:membrane-associated protein
VSSLVDRLLDVPAWAVYLVSFALVFAEDALFIGFVLPGETAAILAGVASSQGNANLYVSIVVVVAAAILGDSVGYEIGRIFGRRLFHLKPLRSHEQRLDDAQRFLAKWGGWAVFFGRFTAFFRAVIPALAGAAGMPYRRFLFYNALGGIVWGTGCVLLGYIAGDSYHAIEKYVGRGAAGLAALVVIVLIVVWRVRKSRADKVEESQYDVDREEA